MCVEQTALFCNDGAVQPEHGSSGDGYHEINTQFDSSLTSVFQLTHFQPLTLCLPVRRQYVIGSCTKTYKMRTFFVVLIIKYLLSGDGGLKSYVVNVVIGWQGDKNHCYFYAFSNSLYTFLNNKHVLQFLFFKATVLFLEMATCKYY